MLRCFRSDHFRGSVYNLTVIGLGLIAVSASPVRGQTPATSWVRQVLSVGGTGGGGGGGVTTDSSGNVIFIIGDYFAKYSPDGVGIWSNNFPGSPCGLHLDSQNNVYVAGTSGDDFLTMKYSSSGGILWSNRFDASTNHADAARASALDPAGNIYTVGATYSGLNSTEFTTLKQDASGATLWAQHYRETNDYDMNVFVVAVDGASAVYVAGYSYSASVLVVLEYSAAGGLQWKRRLPLPCLPASMQIDGNGDVLLLLNSGATSPNYEIFVYTLKIDSSGSTLWTNRFGVSNPFGCGPAGLAVDSSRNSFVSGYVVHPSSMDYCTVKTSPSGKPLWTNWYGSASSSEYPYQVVLDARGEAYVTGVGYGSLGYQMATVKYSTQGTQQWAIVYPPPPGIDFDNCHGRAVTIDPAGNVYVLGSYDIVYNCNCTLYLLLKYGPQQFVPPLKIRPDAGDVLLSWTMLSTNVALQETGPPLPNPAWVTVTNAPQVIGDERVVRKTIKPAGAYYRLRN